MAFTITNISSLPMNIPRAVIMRPQLEVFGPITEAESPVVAKAEANSKEAERRGAFSGMERR